MTLRLACALAPALVAPCAALPARRDAAAAGHGGQQPGLYWIQEPGVPGP